MKTSDTNHVPFAQIKGGSQFGKMLMGLLEGEDIEEFSRRVASVMTLTQSGEFLNKVKGMLVGLAVGDALGMVCEFARPGEFEYVDGMRAGGPFDLPKGHWTDDTSMALCLAASLLEKQGYDSFDVMDKYVKWRNEGYLSSIGFCFDCGGQIQAELNEFEKDPQRLVPVDQPRTEHAGNGAIMRLAPVVLAAYRGRSAKSIVEMARISARETHYSYEAEAATEVFAAMLIRAMQAVGQKSEVEGIELLSTGERFNDVWQRVSQVDELQTSGYIIHSLQVAWWAFQQYDSFEEGMLAVVNLGGDADTNGAIYGQLAGAFYGYEAIPEEWREELHDEADIADMAAALFAMSECPVRATRFAEDAL